MLHFLPHTSVLLDAREPPFMSVPLLNWNCAVVLALPAGDSLPAKEKGAAPVENGEAPELAPILNPGPFLLDSEDWPNAEPLPRMSMTLPDLSWAAGPIPTLGLDTIGAVTTHTILRYSKMKQKSFCASTIALFEGLNWSRRFVVTMYKSTCNLWSQLDLF